MSGSFNLFATRTGLSQEKEPGQDGLGQEDGRDAEVELPLSRFVPEKVHPHECAYAAADDGQPDEGVLRNAPLPPPGLPFVDPEDQESQEIDADEIDEECSHGCPGDAPVEFVILLQI